jgi:hypothetical protein
VKRAARIGWGMVAALVLLIAGLAWHGGSGWLARSAERFEQGRAAGAGRDDHACVELALRVDDASQRFGDVVGDSVWLRGCLNAARPTGVCVGVPAASSPLEAGSWVARSCAVLGGADDLRCHVLLNAVVGHCDPAQAPDRPAGAGT